MLLSTSGRFVDRGIPGKSTCLVRMFVILLAFILSQFFQSLLLVIWKLRNATNLISKILNACIQWPDFSFYNFCYLFLAYNFY